MFVVAIAELAGDLQNETALLASELGCTAYDARLLLAPGLPAVVRTTPDRAQAVDLLSRLRARGHGVVACDGAAVVASEAMVSMRRFRLEGDAIALEDLPLQRLPYQDILALLPAVHRSRMDSTTQTRERRFSVGRALVTSGLAMTKAVKQQVHATSEERDNVLYVFRRSGETPWILRDSGTVWAGHGRTVAPAAAENFRLALTVLRERATEAVYDERLMTRRASERAALSGSMASSTVKTSSDAAMDLLAHLLALWISRSPQAQAQ